MKRAEVIVVGGGWAGLSAACWLAHQNHAVTLLEAAPQLGGRARSVSMDNTLIDNGQHLFIQGYESVQSLLHLCDVDLKASFKSIPLNWVMLGENQSLQIQFPKLKAPYNMLWGLLRAKGLTLKEKISLAQCTRRLLKTDFCHQKTVFNLLKDQQSQKLIDLFWNPLCLAALSTPIEVASSDVFLNVLQKTFSEDENANLWFAKKDLSEILAKPARAFLEQQGCKIIPHERVKKIIMQGTTCLGVESAKNVYSGQVVLATSWPCAKNLLTDIAPEYAAKHFNDFVHEPITTAYLQYPPNLSLPHPMIGLHGCTSQWVFDRKFANQPGLLAVVITGSGRHLTLSHQALIECVHDELHAHWPKFKQFLQARVIHEKRAAFRSDPFVQSHRPNCKTPFEGLYLAGDYCLTPYPATLEGAVLTGKQCADIIEKEKYDRTTKKQAISHL